MLSADRGYTFESGKVYTHAQGLSCCFRQWRASSHCRYLHGYALQVSIKFASSTTNENNWIVDFGGLKEVKGWLEDTFDHKTIIAKDDPQYNFFLGHEFSEVADVVVIEDVGCEAFAKMIFEWVDGWRERNNIQVYLQEVKVEEHPGNFATYRRNP